MILSCSNICKSFGENDILKQVSFHIEDHEKAAIVGINGAGKSTLLKVLIGKLNADDGVVTWAKGASIGYLAQHQDLEGAETIYDALLEVKKPVIQMEARIRSLTRRRFVQEDTVLSCGGISFDTVSRTATAGGRVLDLPRKEAGLLEYLLLHQGRVVSAEELMEHLWDGSVNSFSNAVRVHISALRKKLRSVLGYDPIQNKVGQGYTLAVGKEDGSR